MGRPSWPVTSLTLKGPLYYWYTISSTCESNGSGELKMKALECSQDFSHYKSMGIFPDAQGQLTPQSLVRACRISNSSEMLWMFSLPASMKKIRSKMKAPEWSQHYTVIFQTRKGRYSGVGVGIWPKFELIQAFMHDLVTCKNEDD